MIKFFIFLALLACTGPFFIDGPDGKPMLTLENFTGDFSDLSFGDLGFGDIGDSIQGSMTKGTDLTALADRLPTPSSAADTIRIYKWQDDDGVWQFASEPPADVAAALVEIGSVNILPALASADAPAQDDNSTTPAIPDLSALPSGLTSISGEQMADMMKTINGLQETFGQRQQAMDEAINAER